MTRQLLIILALPALAACSDLMYGRTVTGHVLSGGSRYARSETGGTEKIALALNPYQGDDKVRSLAGDDGTLMLDCVSTRCAALQPGQCAELKCSYEFRIMEPNVLECKLVKTTMCGPGVATQERNGPARP